MGRKLFVEVCSAHNLLPKDGAGSCNAYCFVDFDGQKRKTKVKSKDSNPGWNERFEYDVQDPANMEVLEVNVYSERSGVKGKDTFLDRVKLPGNTFVKRGEEAIVSYPLKKKHIFSRVRGELRMKICYYDEQPTSEASKKEKKSLTHLSKQKN